MTPEIALLAIVVAAPSQGAIAARPPPRSWEQGLISTWEGPLAERVEELLHDGQEDAVLGPLARYPVAATIGGERWNSGGPAMKGLVCDCRHEAGDLLSRFAAVAFAVPSYGSPLPDDLAARRVLDELRAGRCDEPRDPVGRSSADPLTRWSRRDPAGLRAFLSTAASAQ